MRGDENVGNLDYFGVLTGIIKLSYSGGNNVVLFRCDLVGCVFQGERIQRSKYEFILTNIVNVN